jgi:hypothetical protein
MQHVARSNGNGKSHTNIVVVPLSSTFSSAATMIRTQLGCKSLADSLTNISITPKGRRSRASVPVLR